MFNIQPLSEVSFVADIRDKIANKTKPLGALGQLESLAEQLALIQGNKQNKWPERISICKPTAIVFAGDHGIAAKSVSIAPADVTRQMVLNFLQGGAAINCFCKSNNIAIKIVDAGIKTPLTIEEKELSNCFVEQRLGAGTSDISEGSAMSPEQVEQGLEYGKSIIQSVTNSGSNVVMLGEMGIANTSAASAIFMVLSGMDAEQCVGQGTGITPLQLSEKRKLITKAVNRVSQSVNELDAKTILAELGGFEIVQIVGAILAAAEVGVAVLIDGFIVTSAALLAVRLHPEVKDYLIYAHQSDEQAHRLMLDSLGGKPLLSLGLRLGEGTGAALALPLLQAATSFYNDMATFESAGVTV